METIGAVLIIVGAFFYMLGYLKVLIIAFQEGTVWGIASLLFPLVGLAFVLTYWERARSPFLIGLSGVVFMIGGIYLLLRLQQ